MTYEQNVKAVLECCFSGFKEEIIDGVCEKICELHTNESVTLQESKWIPCSERMPEKSGLYLVSGRGKVWIYEMLDIMGLKGWCGELGRPIVKAWMPLPEPYKAENEVSE